MGDPVTPPRHWEALIAAMTPEQRKTAKTLMAPEQSSRETALRATGG
jgi:hypothetical protein